MGNGPSLVPLLVVMAVLAMAVTIGHLRARHRLQRRMVTCPKTCRRADCVVRIREPSGRAVAIERCTALPDPDRVDCNEACLHELNSSLRSGSEQV
jgi:hypothetical protein